MGFALEDYSALRYLYARAMQYGVGDDISLIPPAADPKNLFALIGEHAASSPVVRAPEAAALAH